MHPSTSTHTFPRKQRESFSLIAGPCAIESYDSFLKTAKLVQSQGATALRGGIFKMRTRADAFQGLRAEAFEMVKAVKAETRLPFVTEVTDPRQIDSLRGIADVFQVGTRNMHNFELLKELGKTSSPILLKRGWAAYLDEVLYAVEYISREGNQQIILCERGIRSFEKATRNTLDLAAVPYLQARCPYPVFVDPSHATGVTELVTPMCLAAAAAGADGLLIEVHPEPAHAALDGAQALTFGGFTDMVSRLRKVLSAVGRKLEPGLAWETRAE